MNVAQRKITRSVLLTAAVAFLLAAMAGCGDSDGQAARSIEQNSVAVGDFNGDGRLDLAVSSSIISGVASVPGRVDLFFQDPLRPGSFIRQAPLGVGRDPFQVAAAELNGDNFPDLVVANAGSDSVSVLLNNPSRPGSFLPARNFPCGPNPLSVAIGDLDDDGRPDLAVAVANGVDILYQSTSAPGAFLPPVIQELIGGTFSVAIGDLDGDGISDIAAAGPDAVYVFFQDPPTGDFFLPERFFAGLVPNGVVVADIDRDGLRDIAVANLGSAVNGSGASISVLIQDPVFAGNFLPTRNFAAPDGAQNLAVGDLNVDGLLDIAVASVVLDSPDPGVVSVFLQTPGAPGDFTLAGSFPNGFTPLAVAIGDFNADARQDIVVQDGPAIFFQDPLRPGTFFNEIVVGP